MIFSTIIFTGQNYWVCVSSGGGGIFMYLCSAQLISSEMNLKTTDFKRNSSGRTPPPPPQSKSLYNYQKKT